MLYKFFLYSACLKRHSFVNTYIYTYIYKTVFYHETNQQTNSLALVCERTIPTERNLPVCEDSANLFADRGYCVVSATHPHGSILDFLDWSPYFFFQVALQLYSRGWEVVDLERGPLRLVCTTEQLLERKSSGSILEIRKYGRRDLSH
jgi:hypothetical protein